MKRFFFRRSRIYILPTKMGGYFNGLVFLMFLLSVGYTNNLLLIFTLFLFGFNLIWLVQTHFHLKALVPDIVILEDGHVGESLPVLVRWRRRPLGSPECNLTLYSNKHQVGLQHLVHEDEQTSGAMQLERRGPWHWDTLRIETDRPFGLYRAWIYWPINVSSYAWPALQKDAQALILDSGSLEGEVPTQRRGQWDMKGLLPYFNEEARLISWKHYARTGQLLVREGEEVRTPEAHFTWEDQEGNRKEERLSQLATAMVFCHRQEVPFSLKIAGKTRGPASSRPHLLQCLKELSLC